MSSINRNKKPRRSPSVRSGGFTGVGIPTTPRSGSENFPAASIPLTGPGGKGFGSDLPTIPNNDPNWNNPYSGVNSGNGAAISRLFSTLSNGGNPLQALLSLLDDRHWSNEEWAMFLQYALQQASNSDQRSYDQSLTKDQREYDWNLLQDSRLYNNPQNELARLMGAGVSRDAAIQILSGAAGGSGVGTGGSPVTSSPVPVGSVPGTPGAQELATIQTALQGVQAVVNMTAQGIDMASAISNAQMLQAQNSMTQSQLQAFQGVNNITQAFNRAVFDGTLTIEDVQGLRTADDYYRWITDHADTNFVKPLVQNGSVAAAFGSTFGRGMMNNHLEQTRQGRDSAQLFDNYLRQSDLDTDLKDVLLAQNRRNYYVSFATTLNDILTKDADLALLYQSYLNGEKIIEINGHRVDVAKYEAEAAKRNNFTQQVYFDAFQSALDKTFDVNMDGRQATLTGRDVINYNAFTTLIRSFQENRALSGLHGVLAPDEDGGKTVVTARERYARMLDENVMVAITGAFIQDVINSNRLSGYSGDLAPLYRFADMWNASGLGNVVKTVSDIAPDKLSQK